MTASKNRFAPELNEKEVIELLEDLSYILRVFFNKTIIPFMLVGYAMIIANLMLQCTCLVGYLSSRIQHALVE